MSQLGHTTLRINIDMKQKTKDLAIKWLETAKSSDTFSINTVPHSRSEIEALLGFPASNKKQPKISIEDLEDKDYGDMEQESDEGHSEESGD